MSTPLTPPDPQQPTTAEAVGQAMGGVVGRWGINSSDDASAGQVVWRAMGGWRGIIESVLPGLAFIVLYTVTLNPEDGRGDLIISLGISVGIAAVFTLIRLIQKSPPAAALGGLIAAAAAAALALWTGRGEDNFVFGFVTNSVYGTALLVSALTGWSLIGLGAGYLRGEGLRWRRQPRSRRVYFWLAIAWAALFFARLAVQVPLYFAQEVALLGITKLAMGLPLFAPMVAVTWLAIRALPAVRESSPAVEET